MAWPRVEHRSIEAFTFDQNVIKHASSLRSIMFACVDVLGASVQLPEARAIGSIRFMDSRVHGASIREALALASRSRSIRIRPRRNTRKYERRQGAPGGGL